MKRSQKITAGLTVGTVARVALAASAAVLALVSPGASFAQGAAVTLHQDVTAYRAFYYDQTDKLLHIEIVYNVGGRKLTPLFSPATQAPQDPPDEQGKAAVLIGANAKYAVYYGLSGNAPKPQSGDINVQSSPVAIEKLTDADSHRAIECASKGGDTCSFPRMCHCGAVGSCCCY